MKVWIVFEGEENEGGIVRSVHSTPEGALQAVLKMIDNNSWAPDPDEDDRWISNSDFVEILEFYVRGF